MQPASVTAAGAHRSWLRRALDRLYWVSGGLAATALAGTCVVMLAQVVGRESGVLLRGADDITAWLCAAAAFLALGHTFRRGELVRMGLVIEALPPAARRRAEILSLSIAALFTGYMTWAVVSFVYESWKFHEVAQGLLKIPIWIPQLSFAIGVGIFFIAVVDELAAVLRGEKPAYRLAEEERRARGDFSESV